LYKINADALLLIQFSSTLYIENRQNFKEKRIEQQ